jgi:hypothetical protein
MVKIVEAVAPLPHIYLLDTMLNKLRKGPTSAYPARK